MEKKVVSEQLTSVMTDFEVKAVKIGVVASSDIVDAIVEVLKEYKEKVVIVVDPVAVSTSGHDLITNEAFTALANRLIPSVVTVLTPNLQEAKKLWETLPNPIKETEEIQTIENAKNCALSLSQGYSVPFVVIKGIKKEEEMIDVIYDKSKDEFTLLTGKYYSNSAGKWNTHGSGCSYSSSIAAVSTSTGNIVEAIRISKKYVEKAIQHGFRAGKSEVGTLNHFIKDF